ncbi:MAG TPA: YceI family protein [Actinoplanes sp.]|nr:YceI family protein [Actinoplanes sp.]
MTNTLTRIQPGTYAIDPIRSEVRFTATHVFGLKPVNGTMAIRAGTVTVAAEPRRSTVSAEIDAASWATDDARRDRDVRGKHFLDVQRHPAIGFRSTRVVQGADGWQVIGELSVRGGCCEVTLTLTDIGPDRFTATGRVDRFAAGVGGGRAIIGRHLDVTLTVVVAA